MKAICSEMPFRAVHMPRGILRLSKHGSIPKCGYMDPTASESGYVAHVCLGPQAKPEPSSKHAGVW